MTKPQWPLIFVGPWVSRKPTDPGWYWFYGELLDIGSKGYGTFPGVYMVSVTVEKSEAGVRPIYWLAYRHGSEEFEYVKSGMDGKDLEGFWCPIVEPCYEDSMRQMAVALYAAKQAEWERRKK